MGRNKFPPEKDDLKKIKRKIIFEKNNALNFF